MKISEYIKQLEELKAAAGEVEVLCLSGCEGPLKVADKPGLVKRAEGGTGILL